MAEKERLEGIEKRKKSREQKKFGKQLKVMKEQEAVQKKKKVEKNHTQYKNSLSISKKPYFLQFLFVHLSFSQPPESMAKSIEAR